jgi:hypothetical protein
MTPKQIAIVSGVVIVIGCVIAAIGSATWVDAVGIAAGGLGFLGVIAAAFYAVGQSEDRARAREDAARRSGPKRP